MTSSRPYPEAASVRFSGEANLRIEVTHGVGLHARPSVIFTRLAKTFPCAIELEVNGSGIWFNAKSIVNVMGARVRKGSVLRMRAKGPGAEDALTALSALVRRNFDEKEAHGRSAHI